MDEQIELTIDGTKVQAFPGDTIMNAIDRAGKQTPVICYHPATTSEGLCRVCVVEVEGWRTLAPACITKATEGLVISTKSPRVDRARRTFIHDRE